MKPYPTILFMIIALIITSCTKEENQTDLLPESMYDPLQKTGELFSRARAEKSFSELIISTYQEKGVEEFLLYEMLKPIQTRSNAINSLNQLMDLVEENPGISIAYPSFAFRENQTFAAHLAEIDYTVMLFENPEEVNTLLAFDSDGNFAEISAEFDQNLDYCVVKYDEYYITVDPITKTTICGESVSDLLFEEYNPVESFENYELYTALDLINSRLLEKDLLFRDPKGGDNSDPDEGDPEGAQGDPENGGDDPVCDRDFMQTKDELHRVKWSSKKCIKHYESGFHLPLVEMMAFYAIPNFHSSAPSVKIVTKNVRLHWKEMTGKFSDPLDLDIMTWTPELGDRWQVAWVERDHDAKVKTSWDLGFGVSVTIDDVKLSANLKWSIDIMKNDKTMGSAIIEYCDPALNEGSTYKTLTCDTPSSGFWFKQHINNQ